MMTRQMLLTLLVTIVMSATVQAQGNRTLDELIREVREQGVQEKREFAERVEQFKSNRDRQQELLRQARNELETLDAANDDLLQSFEENAKAIEEQERVLKQRVGYLNELHGVVRQIASDMQGSLETSLVSAEQPGRAIIADELATSSELPSISSLEELWQQALNEIAAAGKVTQFDAVVVDTNGEESQRRVTRVGTFNAFSDGLYLGYSADTGKLVEPQRQPSRRFQSMVRDLEQARDGIHPVAIDPTRGTLLSLLIQSPDTYARIKQGGPIGIVIIALGIIGLLVAISRFIVLSSVYRKVRTQLQDKTPGTNPLGRIMQVYYDNKHVDTDTLGHKLDETILREMHPLQRGLGAIAIIAAVGPLLGLLGTVTGIIETFQSITLFGTGDPRLMSAGISEALVTTVLGLIIAIPLLFIHSFLSAKSNAVIQILDQQSAAYIAMIAESEHQAGNKKSHA